MKTSEQLISLFQDDRERFKERLKNRITTSKANATRLKKMKIANELSLREYIGSQVFAPKSLLTEAGRIITSVNYRGQRKKQLQKKPGFARHGFQYTPLSASQKMRNRMSAKKRIRTIKAKGIGFKNRMAKHARLAWKRRKQFGLR